MTPIVACIDLDRTLIWSPTALDLRMPDHEAPRLLCVEVYQGRPLSFITERAAGLLVQLAREEKLVLVPTTTRVPRQLARVHLPGRRARYAIAGNGGNILVDGHVDQGWSAHMAQLLAEVAPLAEVRQRLERHHSEEWLETLRDADDLFVYAVTRRELIPQGLAEELSWWADERGWRLSLQGRKLYLVPKPLTKSAAAAEIARRHGAEGFVAAGDSLLDAELLASATRAARPCQGELASSGWTCPGLTVLEQPGVLAGEELLEWLVALSTPPEP